MALHFRILEAESKVETSFGRLPFEEGINSERVVSAEAFAQAAKEAHALAWVRGESGFVFTREMAQAAGVI